MPISNADKIRNAATMFGSGSKQHKAAIKRFGAPMKKKKPSGGSSSSGKRQRRDSNGRFA